MKQRCHNGSETRVKQKLGQKSKWENEKKRKIYNKTSPFLTLSKLNIEIWLFFTFFFFRLKRERALWSFSTFVMDFDHTHTHTDTNTSNETLPLFNSFFFFFWIFVIQCGLFIQFCVRSIRFMEMKFHSQSAIDRIKNMWYFCAIFRPLFLWSFTGCRYFAFQYHVKYCFNNNQPKVNDPFSDVFPSSACLLLSFQILCQIYYNISSFFFFLVKCVYGDVYCSARRRSPVLTGFSHLKFQKKKNKKLTRFLGYRISEAARVSFAFVFHFISFVHVEFETITL